MPPLKLPLLPLSILDYDRTILLYGDITTDLSRQIVTKLLELDALSRKPIELIISSEGGNFLDVLAIIDTIRMLRSPVHTTGIGACLSGAAVLLAAGTPGHRHLGKNSWVMLHELHADMPLKRIHDLDIEHRWNRDLNQEMIDLLAEFSGCVSASKLSKLLRNDYVLLPERVLELGLIDEIF